MKELVYFIKHKGLSPIKIGKSTKDALKGRLGQLKTSSPYGIEIVGIIETCNAHKLENLLHKRFKAFRLNGEWFEISEDVVNGLLLQYQDKEFIDAKNEFILSYYQVDEKEIGLIDELKRDYFGKVLQLRDLLEIFKGRYTKREINNELSKKGYYRKVYSVNGKSKKGYKIT